MTDIVLNRGKNSFVKTLLLLAFLLMAYETTAAAQNPPSSSTAIDSPVLASGADAQPSPSIAFISTHNPGHHAMAAELFKPGGAGPFPVVVYSHGRTAARRLLLKDPVPSEQVKYWVSRGFALVAPIRPGYGITGGADVESPRLLGILASTVKDGPCATGLDFRITAFAAREAVLETVRWLDEQPWADAKHVVLVGTSVGGLASVAAGASQPSGVIGYINFAGGSGGVPDRSPGHSCDPQQLTSLYADLGRTTVMPNLWIYAQNDQYWGVEMPKMWHTAFASGGSPTEFVQTAPVSDGNGHGLSRHPSILWAPLLDSFLARLNLEAFPQADETHASPRIPDTP